MTDATAILLVASAVFSWGIDGSGDHSGLGDPPALLLDVGLGVKLELVNLNWLSPEINSLDYLGHLSVLGDMLSEDLVIVCSVGLLDLSGAGHLARDLLDDILEDLLLPDELLGLVDDIRDLDGHGPHLGGDDGLDSGLEDSLLDLDHLGHPLGLLNELGALVDVAVSVLVPRASLDGTDRLGVNGLIAVAGTKSAAALLGNSSPVSSAHINFLSVAAATASEHFAALSARTMVLWLGLDLGSWWFGGGRSTVGEVVLLVGHGPDAGAPDVRGTDLAVDMLAWSNVQGSAREHRIIELDREGVLLDVSNAGPSAVSVEALDLDGGDIRARVGCFPTDLGLLALIVHRFDGGGSHLLGLGQAELGALLAAHGGLSDGAGRWAARLGSARKSLSDVLSGRNGSICLCEGVRNCQ